MGEPASRSGAHRHERRPGRHCRHRDRACLSRRLGPAVARCRRRAGPRRRAGRHGAAGRGRHCHPAFRPGGSPSHGGSVVTLAALPEVTPIRSGRGGFFGALSDLLWRKPRLTLLLMLTPPLLWLGIIYLGSLFALLLQSFFAIDPYSGLIRR